MKSPKTFTLEMMEHLGIYFIIGSFKETVKQLLTKLFLHPVV